MRLSINDFFRKYDQIRRKLRIWSHLLKNSLMENFIFLCSVIQVLEKPENILCLQVAEPRSQDILKTSKLYKIRKAKYSEIEVVAVLKFSYQSQRSVSNENNI